jgi:hypothetical protein
MAVHFSDQQIDELLKESKPLPDDYKKRIRLRDKYGHKERDLSVDGVDGHKFRLILRSGSFNVLDFSVVLAIVPSGSNTLFRLRRYNGKSHEHTNKIEQETFYDFHIHTATERYQQLGVAEDFHAVPTKRYTDFYSALDCMLQDCGFVLPSGSMKSFPFGEEESP